MGFTLLATLDEDGMFVSQFLLPFTLTEEQQSEIRHGYVDCSDVETYFWVDDEHDLDDWHAVDNAYDMIAELHVIDVKSGLFSRGPLTMEDI